MIAKKTMGFSLMFLLFLAIVYCLSLPVDKKWLIHEDTHAENLNKPIQLCNGRVHRANKIRPSEIISASKFIDYFESCEGWSILENWGMWSDSSQSDIVLISPDLKLSRLIIKGQYFPQPTKTKVSINGIYLGNFDLRKHEFNIEKLINNQEIIEIKLEHSAPSSPSAEDKRLIEFGLISLEFK